MHNKISNSNKNETTIDVQSFESRVLEIAHRWHWQRVVTFKSSPSQGIRSKRHGDAIMLLIFKKICKLVNPRIYILVFCEITWGFNNMSMISNLTSGEITWEYKNKNMLI